MLPAAPSLFSTITGCPSFAAIPLDRIRGSESVVPPGAKPTMILMAFVGYSCASPSPGTAIAATAAAELRRKSRRVICRMLIHPPRNRWHGTVARADFRASPILYAWRRRQIVELQPNAPCESTTIAICQSKAIALGLTPGASNQRMTLRQLRYFTRIVEAGNITRAAEQLYVAQPALGMQIRQLEESLGVELLERHSRGVSPTRAGQALYERACEILRLVHEAEQQ